MSDEREIVRLETVLPIAATSLAPKTRVSLHCYGSDADRWSAYLWANNIHLASSYGTSKLKVLRDVWNKVLAELVQRRDEHNAAIAMLESE